MDKSKEYLKLKDLAIKLGVSESSVRYHIRQKRIKPSFKLGSRMLFNLEDTIKQLSKGL